MPPKRTRAQAVEEPEPKPTRRLRSGRTTVEADAPELPEPKRRRRTAKQEAANRPSEDTLVEARDPLSNDKLNVVGASSNKEIDNTVDVFPAPPKVRRYGRAAKAAERPKASASTPVEQAPPPANALTTNQRIIRARATAMSVDADETLASPAPTGRRSSRAQGVAVPEDPPVPPPKPRGRKPAVRKAKSPPPIPEESQDEPEQAEPEVDAEEVTIMQDQSRGFLPQFRDCVILQKRASLYTLRHCSSFSTDSAGPANQAAAEQLTNLLTGTVTRSEGNSCLLLGPKGCGKSELLDSCLAQLECKPVILRLNGLVQTTDRHALREIGVQLLQQTGKTLLLETSDPNATEDTDETHGPTNDDENDLPTESLSLPPASQLHTLIPLLATLKSPVVVILDAFDLFALHPRQSLLYCLLDTAQHCRAGTDSSGLAVIGMSSRIDTIQLLEKRVKSRFSGRTIRMAPPSTYDSWVGSIRSMLTAPVSGLAPRLLGDWSLFWAESVDLFLGHGKVSEVFKETFSLTKDIRVVIRLLTPLLLALSADNPSLSTQYFENLIDTQRARPSLPFLSESPYPTLCVLIAIIHSEIAGHPAFTFEMIYDCFNNQVCSSASAPVANRGVGVGMVRCSRLVLLSAFEDLVERKLLVPIGPPSTTTAKEFTKYRCNIERGVIRKAVERSGQVNLKKWLGKGQ